MAVGVRKKAGEVEKYKKQLSPPSKVTRKSPSVGNVETNGHLIYQTSTLLQPLSVANKNDEVLVGHLMSLWQSLLKSNNIYQRLVMIVTPS